MGKLNIVSGNLFDYLENKDLIVNSANKYLAYGGGICGQIYKIAGKKLEEYCNNNYKEYLEVNDIIITPNFNIGIDILNIYCPKKHESKKPLEDLLKSYNNIFIAAKNKGYKNIISVSLGTGIHGYKHNEIAINVINELKYLVKEYDINFTLVLANEKIYNLYIN